MSVNFPLELFHILVHGILAISFLGKPVGCCIGAGTGPAGPAMAGSFSAKVDT